MLRFLSILLLLRWGKFCFVLFLSQYHLSPCFPAGFWKFSTSFVLTWYHQYEMPSQHSQCTLPQQDTALFKGLFSFPHHLRARRFLSCLLRRKLYQKISPSLQWGLFLFPQGFVCQHWNYKELCQLTTQIHETWKRANTRSGATGKVCTSLLQTNKTWQGTVRKQLKKKNLCKLLLIFARGSELHFSTGSKVNCCRFFGLTP